MIESIVGSTSVLRVAKAIVARRPELSWKTGEGLGGTLVIYNRCCVMSYAMARTPPRWWTKAAGKGMEWRIKNQDSTEAELRARLREEGPDHKHIVPGVAWWRHVQMHIAERDGDVSRLAQ